MAKNQGILVEVDGLALEVLEMLEEELTSGPNVWTPLTEIAQAVDTSPSNLINLLSTLSRLTRSLSVKVAGEDKVEIPWERQKRQFKEVVTELLDRDQEPYFRCIFHKLNGAHVPLAGVYEDVKEVVVEKPVVKEVEKIVEKVIEKPVEKLVKIEVGAALKRPSITPPTREKNPARSKTDADDSVFMWSPNPGVPEKIEGFVEPKWYAKMKRRIEWGSHIALEGPAGQGKSTAIQQLAAEYNVPLVSYNCSSGLHQRDLKGFAEVSDKTSRFDVAQYATAAIKGWWVQIDEINFADPDAIGFLFGQLAPPYKIDLHGKSFPVHENFRLFVTYNLGEVGTKMLSTPFKDRFTVIQVPLMDDTQLEKLLILHGAEDDKLITSMIAVARALWMSNKRYQLSPRRLFEAITEVRDGVDLKTALMESILPHVFLPPEIPQITTLIESTLNRSELINSLEVRS